MLDAYQPILLLTALWPTQEFEFPADRAALAGRLREVFAEFGEHHVVQGPEVAMPPEVPRVVLLGEGRQWALELAPGKISLRRNARRGATLADLFGEEQGLLLGVQAWLAENLNFRAYRLGVLVHLFCNTRSSANEKIAQYYLQPRAASGPKPHEIQLGLLARPVLGDGSAVNRWLRVRPLRTVDARHVDFAAQFEIDINTLPENTQVKTARDVGAFLDAARHYIETEIPVLNDEDFLA
jgi:hypothetical protein